jgi:copper resistance protein C
VRLHGRHAIAALLVGIVTCTFAALVTPTMAAAHDQVIGTSPKSGEFLDVAPENVSMEFTGKLLDIGATILVVDDSGVDWALGEKRIDGSSLVQPVDPAMPDGRYQVRWRVVSSDGHPISGTFDFAVGTVTSAQPAPSLRPETDSTSGRNDTVVPPYLAIGIGGAIGGVLLFILITMLLPRWRPRRPRDDGAITPRTPSTKEEQ